MRLSELHGRPVVSASTGGRLGRVDRVLLDLANRRVAGVQLRHGGLFDRRWRVAAIEDVTEVSEAAIVVPDALALREYERLEGQAPLRRHGPAVADGRGTVIGCIADGLVECRTGRLLALLVAPLAARGARTYPEIWVPIERVCGSRPDTAVIDEEACRLVRAQHPSAHDPAQRDTEVVGGRR